VPDPVACDPERVHRHGDAVPLSHQTGLTINRTLQERHAGCRTDPADEEASDLLAAFDRAEHGADEAATVARRGGVGVEEADEGVDVPGLHRLLEVPDEAGLAGCRGRGRLRGANAAAGRGGQLAACRRGPADDLGHFAEGVAEDIMQDERNALGRGHRFEHNEEGHADRLIQGDPVGPVGRTAARPPVDPFRTFGQRLGDPFTHVALAPGPRRAEQVQADAAGNRRQPGAGGFGGFPLVPRHGVPAGIRLLHGILSLGQGAEQPVGEIDQLAPLAHDRAQLWIGSYHGFRTGKPGNPGAEPRESHEESS
jgi:hypothetical protein